MSRWDGLEIENVSNVLIEDVGNPNKPIGNPIRIYKFRQVSGYTIFTKNGEIPKFQSINQEEQFANFKTGQEPITIVWEGSSNLKNSVEEPNIPRVKYKVGTYEIAYSISEYSNAISTIEKEIFGANFTVDLKETTTEFKSYTWAPTVEDQINYFYIVVDKRYPNYQLLQLVDYSTEYNEVSGELSQTILKFENINLKYASSGRQVLDFVQFGSIGFGYAFPKEFVNEENGKVETILDWDKLQGDGVQSLQVDTNTTSGLKSLTIYGAPLNPSGSIYNQPQRLFLLDSLLPENSSIFYNNQQMNFYFVEGAKPKYKTYIESYTNNPDNPMTNLGNYNVGSQKKFLGGFEVDKATVESSNPINSTSGKRTHSINSNEKWIPVKNSYTLSKYINGVKDLIAETANPLMMKTTDFLNFNSYVDFYTDQFTYEISSIIKYPLTKVLGILGGLVNTILGGIDVGWTKDKTLNLAQPLNFLVATDTFDMGVALRPALEGKLMIPLELFSDDKESSLMPIDNRQLCSFHFSLTDHIKDTSQIIAGAPIGKGGQGIWNTKYIGQVYDEEFNFLLPDRSMFSFNPRTTIAIPNPFNSNQKYVIDTIDFKAVYSGDAKITAFVKDVDIYTDKFYNRSVYSSIFSTTSKIANKFRLISTFIKFNFWEEFNTIGSVPNTWPELLPPPSPTPVKEFIWIESIKYGEPLFQTQSISAGKNITNKQIIRLSGTADVALMEQSIVQNISNTNMKMYEIISDTSENYVNVGRDDTRELYDLLLGEGINSIPNQLRTEFNFDILKYTDDVLSNFNRVAIEFINEYGQTLWMKIPNIDFVALKNTFDLAYYANAPAGAFLDPQFYNNPTPIKIFANNKKQEIQLSWNVVEHPNKLQNLTKKTTGDTRLSIHNFKGKVYFVVALDHIYNISFKPALSPVYSSKFLWSGGMIEVGEDILVQDYNSTSTRLRIRRVIILNKNYDETNDITYIN